MTHAGATSRDADVTHLVVGRAVLLPAATLLAGFQANASGTITAAGVVALTVSAVLSLGIIATAIPALWRRLPWWGQGLAFLADTIAAVTIVYLTGVTASSYTTLPALVALLGGVLLTARIAATIALIGCGSYAAVVLLLAERIIPAPFRGLTLTEPPGGFYLHTAGVGLGILLVAAAGHFLVRRLQESVASHRATVAHLEEQHRDLFNTIEDGVIVTDATRRITKVNRKAELLLHRSASTLIDLPVTSLLSDMGASDPDTLLVGGRCELGVVSDAGPGVIEVSARVITDTVAGDTGVVLTVRDITALRSAEERLRVHERMAQLLADERGDRSKPVGAFGEFAGESPVMRKVFQLIEKVAPSDATVLIYGESGTGKELVARAIHSRGTRSRGPFVPVNCGAIPENLIESELFGHKKGSFTGADSDTLGLFRQAEGGTLFLDEIGELPLSMQAKLLRALQSRAVRPVGATKDIPIDVRIVAATNRNLRREIEAGRFREDLYFRLNVINISLPPLRERKEDLPPLISAILARTVRNGVTPVVSPDALQQLSRYSYPGNVRELENILERAYVLGGEVILPEHLPEQVRSGTSLHPSGGTIPTEIIVDERVQLPVDLDAILNAIERRYLELALKSSGGAKKRAAELLGINFRSFRYRLQKYALQEGGEGEPGEPSVRP